MSRLVTSVVIGFVKNPSASAQSKATDPPIERVL